MLGWQAGWCCLGNDAGEDEGSVPAKVQMGNFANRAFTETTGELKIKAWGAGVVRDVTEGMKGDYFMDWDILKAYGALTIKGTMMAARTSRVVIEETGVGLVRRV